MDIITGEKLLSITLLTCNTFIGQFVHPVGGDWKGYVGLMVGIVILASCEYHFLREQENVVQHPSNNISISLIDNNKMIIKSKVLFHSKIICSTLGDHENLIIFKKKKMKKLRQRTNFVSNLPQF